MSEMTKYAPGTFCWVELATTNSEAAKAFYKGLFDWQYSDNPVGEGMIYTMIFQKGDKEVAAMYQMNEEQKSQGVPPHWNSYVSVDSADDTAAKARSLGANILAEPFDVFDVGRMAILQDPTGATFSIWQPKQHIGAILVNEPGTFCWNELATNDTRKAGKFYTELFGWETKETDMGDFIYTEFQSAGRSGAGMMPISPDWGEVPPNWLVYFAVDDCDETVARAVSSGGQQLLPPTDIPNVGRFAVLQDPQHAAFAVIKLEAPA